MYLFVFSLLIFPMIFVFKIKIREAVEDILPMFVSFIVAVLFFATSSKSNGIGSLKPFMLSYWFCCYFVMYFIVWISFHKRWLIDRKVIPNSIISEIYVALIFLFTSPFMFLIGLFTAGGVGIAMAILFGLMTVVHFLLICLWNLIRKAIDSSE